jgi:hypothetical protein
MNDTRGDALRLIDDLLTDKIEAHWVHPLANVLVESLDEAGLLVNPAHLEALRRISEALGHPYRGDTTKSCLDLADLAVIKIGTGLGKEEDLKNNPFRQHWIEMGMKP